VRVAERVVRAHGEDREARTDPRDPFVPGRGARAVVADLEDRRGSGSDDLLGDKTGIAG